MRELEKLDEAESRLLSLVDSVTGTIEEKSRRLEELDVPAQYKAVHRSYAALAQSSVEALKRALFLQWIDQAEPFAFTGVADIDADAARHVLNMLEQLCASDQLDDELRSMLPRYFYLTDCFIPDHDLVPSVVSFCRANADATLVHRSDLDLANRGQMGQYWASVIESGAAVPSG